MIASDGDIEEGVTSEASSLAAVQQLGNLIVFYDHNEISIEDDTNIALCEDTAARYEAYGWHVQHVEGGENVVAIEEAIAKAKAVTDKPSFVSVRTIIGYPAPKLMNTGKAHGSALGDEEVAAVKEALGFDPEKKFEVRDEVIAHTRELVQRGKDAHENWNADFEEWAKREPERKKLLDRLTAEELPDGWDADIPTWKVGDKDLATRAASGKVLNAVGPNLPELWGGSADLAGSNNTTMDNVKSFGPPSISTKDYTARLVRPHPAFRRSRTRDGLDPVRHRAARPDPRLRRNVPAVLRLHAPGGATGGADGHRHHLRLDPRLDRARRRRTDPPADRASGGAARHPPPVGGAPRRRQRDRLRVAHRSGPRQRQRSGRADPDPPGRADPGGHRLEGVAKGGYILGDAGGDEPDVVLIATGSEVQLAVEAQKLLADKDIAARVVSMPCVEWFESQPEEYRNSVLPPSVSARVAVEAGIAQSWHKLVGDTGEIVSLEHYGESADDKTLFREFGFTPEAVVDAAERTIDN